MSFFFSNPKGKHVVFGEVLEGMVSVFCLSIFPNQLLFLMQLILMKDLVKQIESVGSQGFFRRFSSFVYSGLVFH